MNGTERTRAQGAPYISPVAAMATLAVAVVAFAGMQRALRAESTRIRYGMATYVSTLVLVAALGLRERSLRQVLAEQPQEQDPDVHKR